MFPLVAPRPASGPIEQFGFIVGADGVITVLIHANPRPSVIWTIDHESILEGGVDTTQRFQANRVQDMVCIHQFY
jgi:hypothetical protein